MKTYDFVIIGAGSVGLPLSYYLAKAGQKVAVIDKHASAGRGENKSAIGGIRATHSDPAKIKISQYSIEIIKNMQAETGIDVSWNEGGYLFPVYTKETEKVLKNLLIKQKEFKLDIDWVDPDHISSLVPGITSRGLKGGTFSPHDGSASPLKVAGAFFKLAKDAGVDFHFYETVLKINKQGNKVTSIQTDKEEYSAATFVNATGGAARKIGALAGVDLPVYPDSHEAGITEPVERFFTPMVVDIRSDANSNNYYFYQCDNGQVIFCITPNPKLAGTDIDNTSKFLPLVVNRMVSLYPRLRNLRVRRTWRGLYPMTPDGFPIVDYGKEAVNMLNAVGMCGQGFMLGPGLGKILAKTLVENSKDYDFVMKQLTLYRNFSGSELLK